MEIVVSFKKSWGKKLFYPISEHAKLITRITGHPTISKKQLKVCKDEGWTVSVVQDPIILEDVLNE